MTKVTFEQLEAEVRRLAAENPDHVYVRPEPGSRCYYRSPDDTPGCIFGQAMEALGFAIPPGDGKFAGSIDGVMCNILGIAPTFDQEGWARAVQGVQDIGDTWASAVARADRLYPLHQ